MVEYLIDKPQRVDMKKIFLILLCMILLACSRQGDNTKVSKSGVARPKAKSGQVSDFLVGKVLKDSFDDPHSYSSFNFYEDGEFDGDFLSNSDVDGKDFGLKGISENTYNRSEIHKSVFSGKFKVGESISKGVYKLKLEDFSINNEKGPDKEIKYQSWVDFARGLSEDDEYILYLKGALLDDYLLENNQFKKDQVENHEEDDHHDEEDDHHHEEDNHAHEENDHDHDEGGDDHDEKYRAYGIIIYNKSQGIIFTEHDKWAMSNHHHHH